MENRYYNTEVSEEQKVGSKVETYEQNTSTSKDQVRLVFKQNRSFELHIGRSIHRFEGREAKYVSKSVLEHKDFTEEIKKYFVIGE